MNRTSDVESNCLVRVENERHVYRLGLAKKTLPSALEHFTIACMGTRSGLPRNRIFLEYQIDVYITGSPESIVKCSNASFLLPKERIILPGWNRFLYRDKGSLDRLAIAVHFRRKFGNFSAH